MIRSVLRHRCDVQRAEQTTTPEWETAYTWADLAEGLPCLLSLTGHESEDRISVRESDRTAVLFFLPGGPVLRPGDRVTMTAGASGSFELGEEPYRVSDLRQPSHIEWPCVEAGA